MTRTLVLAAAFVSLGAFAQAAPTPAPAAPAAAPAATPPDTEVFVATLDLAAGRVGTPRNVSERVGYDNQPAFLPDGSALLYIAAASVGGNTDVFRYDLASGTRSQVTATLEAEYSPTPLADGSGFSAIRVLTPELEGEAYTESQRLHKYGFDGKPIAPVHDSWKRVGYHAWLDDGRLALWLVGGGPTKLPNTLVLATVADGKQVPLAKDAASVISRSPEGRVTFVDQSIPNAWSLATMMPGDLKPTPIVATPKFAGETERERSREFCWLPDGTLLMARGSTLLRFDSRTPGAGFTTLAEFPDLPGNITRLAASRDGKHLAFVVEVRQSRTRGIRG